MGKSSGGNRDVTTATGTYKVQGGGYDAIHSQGTTKSEVYL